MPPAAFLAARCRFTLGFVGRLTVEKNVRLLVELEKALLGLGCKNFRFLIVGQGVLEPWLRENLRHGTFAGVLKGDALARAYAKMDVFTFPSRTDTFGNVVLEALASGVPAVVTNEGGQSSSSGTARLALPCRMCASFPRRWSG